VSQTTTLLPLTATHERGLWSPPPTVALLLLLLQPQLPLPTMTHAQAQALVICSDGSVADNDAAAAHGDARAWALVASTYGGAAAAPTVAPTVPHIWGSEKDRRCGGTLCVPPRAPT
jgi:hypothetical protein